MDLAGHYWSGHYWSIHQYHGGPIFVAIIVAITIGFPLSAYAFSGLVRGLAFFVAAAAAGTAAAAMGAGLLGAVIPVFIPAAAALCGMRGAK